LIDLHTHTTESDGRFAPAELVARASAAGVTVLAVTDHDTVSGCEAVAEACAAAGIRFVPGIEITAVRDTGDLHILGYFFDPGSPELLAFLSEQRRERIERVRQMVDRLAALGIVLDGEAILKPALDDPRKSAGRPWLAKALVAAGHAASVNEAFERWLERGKPAFVGRVGASPADVIARIHEAGGLASLAHPVLLRTDEAIPGLVASGLDALEAYHSKHDALATKHYLALATDLGVAVSGGSDYHGHETYGPSRLGSVALPRAAYEQLVRLAEDRGAAGRTLGTSTTEPSSSSTESL
jgi:predicted metal-dependent phosphoesterase TrpH